MQPTCLPACLPAVLKPSPTSLGCLQDFRCFFSAEPINGAPHARIIPEGILQACVADGMLGVLQWHWCSCGLACVVIDWASCMQLADHHLPYPLQQVVSFGHPA